MRKILFLSAQGFDNVLKAHLKIYLMVLFTRYSGNERMVDEIDFMKMDYELLRKTMDNRFENQVKYFTIIITIFSIIYGVIFQTKLALDMVLILPLLILPFGLRFQYLNEGIEIISNYLSELEWSIKIKNESQNNKYKYWSGYQNFWNKEHRRWKILVYDMGSKWLLFIFVPMIIAVVYCFLRLNGAIPGVLNSGRFFYAIVASLYLGCIVFTFWFYLYAYLNKHRDDIKKELCKKK